MYIIQKMTKNNTNKQQFFTNFYFWIILIWVIGSVFCFIPINGEKCHDCADQLTAMGTITSIVGFIAALIQIFKTRKSVDLVSESVASSAKRINRVMSFSELSNFRNLPNDIINKIDEGQYKWACEKMILLRNNLISSISSNKNACFSSTERNQANSHLTSIAVHLQTLRSESLNDDERKCIKNFLDELSGFLENLISKTKSLEISEAAHG